ncbi:MAG: hypothetical protein ACE37E_13370 [Hyphomicrobiales bacterium]
MVSAVKPPRARAQEVLALVEETTACFVDMPDEPGQQVHCLFAGLYRETTKRWLQALNNAENPLFTYLVVRRFYDVYEQGVPAHLKAGRLKAPLPWRGYHWLAKRLTMRSSITMHLLLISLGARAHTYHDLSTAVQLGAQDYRDIFGHAVDLEQERLNIIGPVSAKAFFDAAQDYVSWHRTRQTGWRHAVLSVYGPILHALRPLWLNIFEGWRSHAWEIAIKQDKAVQPSKIAQVQPDIPHFSRE